MGQALYRKTRPKKLSEVVGQEHITTTLENALKKGSISHAYLFTGPRGVGKTSIARILAHEINDLPYDDDSMHLDIIEIDAASNRRIDEIRDLRDRVSIAPTSAKYKVYIIDEVHMLTREAFNALLKTLEEPPAHVVFILATTESHKLPETIVSRTQRFMFKPVTLDKVVAHLRSIAEQENIDITDDALELIAKHGEGSFRDSISLLDQAAGNDGKIDAAKIQSMIGIPSDEVITELDKTLTDHNAANLVKFLASLYTQGFSAAHIAKQLGIKRRNSIISGGATNQSGFDLLSNLLKVPSAHDPSRYLEIILLEYALAGAPPSKAQSKPDEPDVAPPTTPKKTSHTEPPKNTEKQQVNSTSKLETSKPTVTTEKPKESGSASLDESVWPKVLIELKKKYNTLYGVVRMAKPEFKPGEVVLGFTFAFHRKRLSEKKNQQIVADIIKQLTGQSVSITCSEVPKDLHTSSTALTSIEKVHASTAEQSSRPDLTNISNIFGGAEVLEQ